MILIFTIAELTGVADPTRLAPVLPTMQNHFQAHGIPLPPFSETASVQGIRDAAKALGLPLMLKSRRGGYDGRGNVVLKEVSDAVSYTHLTLPTILRV